MLFIIAFGLAIGPHPGEGTAGDRSAPENAAAPYRIAQSLAACFCPSNHQQTVISSRARLDEMIETAPCTSRGEGAKERADAWAEQCRARISESGLDFETEALVFVHRFFSSGMITGSLAVSGPRDGELTVGIVQHRPEGPLTPDLGFFQSALIIDKTRIRRVRIDVGAGTEVVLPVEDPTRP